MLFRPATCLLLSSILACGCRSTPPAPVVVPETVKVQPAPAVPVGSWVATPAPADKAPVVKRTPKAIAEVADQLDFEVEGGSRAGAPELWVHVTKDGVAVNHAIVGAVNAGNRLVSSAFTNPQGDARLLAEPGEYKLVAKRGRWQAEQAVSFAKGKDYELALRPSTP